ncbi:MAG: acylneuraminate cytidylyltransferase family protein [Blastochloris sp.]|nr:acylneuraminate cytidylyltransferase family protein [Blastochloris sp.]
MIALITARGGSKGLPGKNIRPLAGKPLLAWSIETARQSPSVERVIVSTDDAEIARLAQAFGAETPFLRPPELAGDQSTHIEVVLHAIDSLEKNGQLSDRILLLQPTCPLRTVADIEAAAALQKNKGCPAVVGVCEAQSHPYLVWKESSAGLIPFIEHGIKYLRRQDLPKAYQINGALYVNSVASLRETRTFVPPGTEPYMMPQLRSVDIDTMKDFSLAEAILSGVVHE